MIIVETKEQLDSFWLICKNWLGMRYKIRKNGDPEIYMNAWTFSVDLFKYVKSKILKLCIG